jgi:acetyl-CoA carboxylase biotin carboxylase subunit
MNRRPYDLFFAILVEPLNAPHTHARQGYLVPPFYDSMIGKLIAHGRDRAQAIGRMRAAIDSFTLEGPKTTLPLAGAIVGHPDFLSNHITTRWLEDIGLPAFQAGAFQAG